MMNTMSSLNYKYKWLILAAMVLLTGLGLSAFFGSNMVSAPDLAALGPECGVLTIEAPVQPEIGRFPPGTDDPINRNPDSDETDKLNREEQPTEKNPAPPCPQWDVFKSKPV